MFFILFGFLVFLVHCSILAGHCFSLGGFSLSAQMVCYVTSTAGGDTRALPSAQEDRHIVIHPHAPNKKTGSEYTADTYITPFPKIRCLKHTHLVSSSISELLTSRWKTKRQHTETIRRLMPLSPYYQSS